MGTFTNSEDTYEMFRQKKYNYFCKFSPTSLDMYNGTIPSLLYQTRRKNPLVYKGLAHLCLKLNISKILNFRHYTLMPLT